MLNFSFFDYLKFMPSPQLFDLIQIKLNVAIDYILWHLKFASKFASKQCISGVLGVVFGVFSLISQIPKLNQIPTKNPVNSMFYWALFCGS
jgi:hypothetical protein